MASIRKARAAWCRAYAGRQRLLDLWVVKATGAQTDLVLAIRTKASMAPSAMPSRTTRDRPGEPRVVASRRAGKDYRVAISRLPATLAPPYRQFDAGLIQYRDLPSFT